MKHETKIEWTHFPGYKGSTWNPTIGCRRKSDGCRNCYAERAAASVFRQFSAIEEPSDRQRAVIGAYKKALKFDDDGNPCGWSGEASLVDHRLDEPLRRQRPTCYFVDSMSDLFYPGIAHEERAAVWGVMAAARHVFIVLTKYIEEAVGWFAWLDLEAQVRQRDDDRDTKRTSRARMLHDLAVPGARAGCDWPLPNVILMTSVENQREADHRIPKLLSLPAAAHGVSYEPALGGVNFGAWPGLDWIVIGGESGPGARPFDVAWARGAIAASRAAGVPVFMKQLGANPVGAALGAITHKKGGEPGEWPDDLRVREFPRGFV